MILISIFELLPEAYFGLGFIKAFFTFLSGVVLIAILNYILPHTHLIKEKSYNCHLLRVAYCCAIGLILHDFPEGFALANSYLHSTSMGIMITIAIALHNIPEEFAMAMPIVMANQKKEFSL